MPEDGLIPHQEPSVPATRLRWWHRTGWKKARPWAFGVSATGCFFFALSQLNQFFSLRGVVNVTASRIYLALAVIAIIWSLFAGSRLLSHSSRKKNLWFLTSCVAVVGMAWLLDWWAPKPKPAATVQDAVTKPAVTPPVSNEKELTDIHNTLEEMNKNLARRGRPQISSAQITAMKEVEVFIGQPDEMSLRTEFGFPEMMNTNIRTSINNLQRYKLTGVLSNYEFPNGQKLVDGKLAKGHIQRKGGAFQMELDALTIYSIVLPSDYVSSKARLVRMTNSTELPGPVISSLKHFDSVIQQNANHLIEVLSASMDKDQNLFLDYDNLNSPLVHKLDALYLDTFISLRPEADKVRDAVRKSLGVE
jgi:hypothetical protein